MHLPVKKQFKKGWKHPQKPIPRVQAIFQVSSFTETSKSYLAYRYVRLPRVPKGLTPDTDISAPMFRRLYWLDNYEKLKCFSFMVLAGPACWEKMVLIHNFAHHSIVLYVPSYGILLISGRAVCVLLHK